MATRHSTAGVRRLLRLTIGCLVLLSVASSATASHVVVHLKDGRTVSGEIDVRTGDDRLWLHAAEPGIVLYSSFAWDDIRFVHHDGQALPADEMRPLASKLRSNAELEPFRRPGPPAIFPAEPFGSQLPGEPLLPPPHDLRVASVHVDAAVANWDSDPEDDGLLVYVYPLTTDGRLRSVDGHLNLKLFGRGTEPALDAPHFPELTRGSLRVRAADFGPDGAVYKFAFRNFHPEKDLDIDVFGLLHARLVVAGQGTFDASDDNVRLRKLSRYRDRLQFGTGRRYLPAENPRRSP